MPISLISALLVCGLLAGCSSKPEEQSAEYLTTPAVQAATTIVAPTVVMLPVLSRPDGVYFVSRDRSVLRRIFPSPVPMLDVSPDSQEVLLSVNGPSQRPGQLLAVDIASGASRVILDEPNGVGFARWSSAGGYVVVALPDPVSGHWLIRGDGSSLKRLSTPGEHMLFGDWLPDDRVLVVVAGPKDRSGLEMDVVTINPLGERSGSLGTYLPCQCGGSGRLPTVAPDGITFAYSDATGEIFVGNIETGRARNITSTAEFDWLGGWTTDGRIVYRTFPSQHASGTPALHSYRLSDGELQVVSGYAGPLTSEAGETVVSPLTNSVTRDLLIKTRTGQVLDLTRGRIPSQWYIPAVEWLPDGSGLVFTASSVYQGP